MRPSDISRDGTGMILDREGRGYPGKIMPRDFVATTVQSARRRQSGGMCQNKLGHPGHKSTQSLILVVAWRVNRHGKLRHVGPFEFADLACTFFVNFINADD